MNDRAAQSAGERGSRAAREARHRPVWLEIPLTLWREILSDHVLMVAGALSYYAVFGLLPALAAAAALLDQLGGFAMLQRATDAGSDLLPKGTVQLLKQFVTAVPEGFGRGTALVLNLGVVLVTCYRAASGLLTALNIAYDVVERRGRLRRGAISLAVGACGIVLLFVALSVIALPTLIAAHAKPQIADGLLWLRWPLLALLFTLGVGLLFRYGPSRARPHWWPVACGAGTAALMWLTASAGVSLYVSQVSSFGLMYGSLGSVMIVMLWFYVSAVAILAGAEIDAVLVARAEGRSASPFRSELRQRERSARSANAAAEQDW